MPRYEQEKKNDPEQKRLFGNDLKNKQRAAGDKKSFAKTVCNSTITIWECCDWRIIRCGYEVHTVLSRVGGRVPIKGL
jgi:hypothetical protein